MTSHTVKHNLKSIAKYLPLTFSVNKSHAKFFHRLIMYPYNGLKDARKFYKPNSKLVMSPTLFFKCCHNTYPSFCIARYNLLVYRVTCRAHLASIRHSSLLPAFSGYHQEHMSFGIGKIMIEIAAPVNPIKDSDTIVTGMLVSHRLDIQSRWYS
jgi:hypothetical protein